MNIYNQFPLNNEPVYVFSVGNQRGEWLATLPEGAEDYFAQWLGGGRGAQFHHRGRFKLPHFRRGGDFVVFIALIKNASKSKQKAEKVIKVKFKKCIVVIITKFVLWIFFYKLQNGQHILY